MIRDTTTSIKKIGGHSILEVYMKGVRAPCMKIDAKYEGRVVKLIEDWKDIDSCKHAGNINRNNTSCCVNKVAKSTPLNKGEIIEIEGNDTIFIVFPLSSLEKRHIK